METELISVIVPVYNVERYLRRCVDSILHQTYQDLEVLLVDDGSTDASGAICDEYAAQEERVTAVHQKNGGLSAARNAGLERAQGTYLCFVDSDDFLDSRMLETLCRRNRMRMLLWWASGCLNGRKSLPRQNSPYRYSV